MHIPRIDLLTTLASRRRILSVRQWSLSHRRRQGDNGRSDHLCWYWFGFFAPSRRLASNWSENLGHCLIIWPRIYYFKYSQVSAVVVIIVRRFVGRSSVKQVIFGRTTTNAKCSESLPISCNIVSRIEDNCHTQSTNTAIPKNYRQGVLRCNNWCEYIIKMRMKKLEWERENYKVEVLSDGQTKRSQITKMTSCRNHSSRKIINRNCRVWRVWISELITDR